MSKIKVQVQLTENALKSFKGIQNHDNFLVSEWGVKYLKGLVELPPKSWLDMYQHWDRGAFKISDFIPFDIRGKVDCDRASLEIVVLITHFKLKKVHSRIWFEKLTEKELRKESAGFN
jgi:ribosomal protein S21